MTAPKCGMGVDMTCPRMDTPFPLSTSATPHKTQPSLLLLQQFSRRCAAAYSQQQPP